MLWFKVFTGGFVIEYVCTSSKEEAIKIAKEKHGEGVYTAVVI